MGERKNKLYFYEGQQMSNTNQTTKIKNNKKWFYELSYKIYGRNKVLRFITNINDDDIETLIKELGIVDDGILDLYKVYLKQILLPKIPDSHSWENVKCDRNFQVYEVV